MYLWKRAQTSSHESATVDLWAYYFNKRVFQDEEWDVATEQAPVEGTRRRVDLVIKYMDQGFVCRVLCFIEAKSNFAGTKEANEAYNQALDACKQHVAATNQHILYVLTILGTRAKPWRFEAEEADLVPLDPEDEFDSDPRRGYIEMHSSQGDKLTAAFNRMKTFLPSTFLPSTFSLPSAQAA